MSRIGKVPVFIPNGTVVTVSGLLVKVEGVKGVLEKQFIDNISIKLLDDSVIVKPLDTSLRAKAMWGTARSIINNMIIGVTQGFKEELEINGVGYRASLQGNKYINLTLGKSHNTKIAIPEGIKVSLPKQTLIAIESIDKIKLGEYVALLKRQRVVEPYKGKGIRKVNEYMQRKEGKKG